MSIMFKTSRPIGFSDIREVNKNLNERGAELYPGDRTVEEVHLVYEVMLGSYYLTYKKAGLGIYDYSPKTKTFSRVERTMGNRGEKILKLFEEFTDIKFQHEDDGFKDPSPNSVSELNKYLGVKLQ